MATAKKLSFKGVHRIWKLRGLKPHPGRTFKLSGDKRFAESRAKRESRPDFLQTISGNLTDIAGVHLNPPGKAGGPEFWAAVDALGDRPYYEPTALEP